MRVTLPNGVRVPISNLSYQVSGSNLVFTGDNGGVLYSYPLPNADPGNLAHLLSQLDQIVANPNAARPPLTFYRYTLSGVTPATFDITLASDVVINGTGFDASCTGAKLRIEDVTGGRDSNGYYLACTYVDSHTLLASYGGPGDAGLGDPLTAYLETADGTQSNELAGTWTAGTTVTLTPTFPATPPTFTSYAASPSGLDGTPANASVYGSVVTITGTGFTAPGGRLVAQDGRTAAVAQYQAATQLRVKLMGQPAGAVTFDYVYTDGQGNARQVTGALTITFS